MEINGTWFWEDEIQEDIEQILKARCRKPKATAQRIVELLLRYHAEVQKIIDRERDELGLIRSIA